MGNNLKWRFGAGLLTVMLPLGVSVHAEENIYAPQSGKPVHYNWGFGSPAKGYPADHFSALFDQSKNYSSGDYFIQTLADDRVRLEADGKWIIDRWSDSAGNIDRALWLGVTEGYHSVKTHYYENTGGAALYSDVLPFNTWIAYYYPNTTLSGVPKAAKVIQPIGKFNKLYEYHGVGAPVNGFQADNYSERYSTAKRVPAGEYIIRAKADDGVRIYIDGKLVLDRWTPGTFKEDAKKVEIADHANANPGEQNVHWIDVEYYDGGHNSGIDFFLEPYETAFDDTWFGEVYPNMSLAGDPYVIGGKNSAVKLSTLNFNWGWGSPNSFIPQDRFSARFTKNVELEAGMYFFDAISDDGLRVWVDDQNVIDAWTNSDSGRKSGKVLLTQGQHKIRVEYFENGGQAKLSLNYKKFQEIPTQSVGTVRYNWGFNSPGNGISSDYFTGVFDQSKYFLKGDYFIQTLADDGVKVEVDGQFPINRWSDSAAVMNRALWLGVTEGQHTVKTHYYENTGGAIVYSDILPLDTWIAYYYPNSSLSGDPTAAKVIPPNGEYKKLYENHGVGAPVSGFKVDYFSARYSTAKRIPVGNYKLWAKADDGVRVYVDGKLVIDRWTLGAFQENTAALAIKDRVDTSSDQKDVHWIDVEYYDATYHSAIEFFIEPNKVPIVEQSPHTKLVSSIKLPVYRSFEELIDYGKHLVFYNPSYTRLMELGYGDAVDVLEEKLYAAKIKMSDGQIGWVQKEYLEASLMEDTWLVKEARTLRSSYSNTSPSLGTVQAGASVYLLDHVTTSGTAYSEWYYVQTQSGQKGWIWGASNAGGNEGYNVVKYEFSKTPSTNHVTIFTPLMTKANITADQINRFINYKTGGKTTVMTNMGYAYLKAQEETGLNAIYLLAHSGLETGWGNSSIVKTKYNFYGIGAIDTRPDEGAYNYSTPEGGIIAGASFIKKNYVDRTWDTDGYFPYSSKPTIDNMRFDNSWHQYATDEAWAVKIGNYAQEFYNFINQ
ncbi:PA14 domain-containing protein [Neobacillus niacini]|uniref:PA14 domain-containing protein n=1 Tax=Neobacillus niacini TaxID=86668 RepID=UPI0007AC1900|nr:PA14 domain-containing protein [Neobacillus niacini]MEC1525885.1 PA14 domain-containing protein [Neobacillus niacini]